MPWRDGVHFDTSSKARIGGAILYSSLPTGSWSGHPIRSVLMTPSTHTQQTCHTLAQRYKKKWVDNDDFYCVQIVIYFGHSPFNISARAGRGTAAHHSHFNKIYKLPVCGDTLLTKLELFSFNFRKFYLGPTKNVEIGSRPF